MQEYFEAGHGPDEQQLADVLLAFGQAPGNHLLRLREPRPLFEAFDTVAQWALGRLAPELQSRGEALEAAAVLFVQRACFASDNTHYQVLGLAQGQPDPQQLRARYRLLIRLAHPDMGVHGLPSDAASRVNQAHKVLASSALRQAYDEELEQRHAAPPRPPARPPRYAPAPAPEYMMRAEADEPDSWLQMLLARHPRLLGTLTLTAGAALALVALVMWIGHSSSDNGMLISARDNKPDRVANSSPASAKGEQLALAPAADPVLVQHSSSEEIQAEPASTENHILASTTEILEILDTLDDAAWIEAQSWDVTEDTTAQSQETPESWVTAEVAVEHALLLPETVESKPADPAWKADTVLETKLNTPDLESTPSMTEPKAEVTHTPPVSTPAHAVVVTPMPSPEPEAPKRMAAKQEAQQKAEAAPDPEAAQPPEPQVPTPVKSQPTAVAESAEVQAPVAKSTKAREVSNLAARAAERHRAAKRAEHQLETTMDRPSAVAKANDVARPVAPPPPPPAWSVDAEGARAYLVSLIDQLHNPDEAQRLQTHLRGMKVKGSLLTPVLQAVNGQGALEVQRIGWMEDARPGALSLRTQVQARGMPGSQAAVHVFLITAEFEGTPEGTMLMSLNAHQGS